MGRLKEGMHVDTVRQPSSGAEPLAAGVTGLAVSLPRKKGFWSSPHCRNSGGHPAIRLSFRTCQMGFLSSFACPEALTELAQRWARWEEEPQGSEGG